jgi:hypothetical protein
MPLSSLTDERVAQLRARLAAVHVRIQELVNATPESLWLRDLDELEAQLREDERAYAEARRSAKAAQHGVNTADDASASAPKKRRRVAKPQSVKDIFIDVDGDDE